MRYGVVVVVVVAAAVVVVVVVVVVIVAVVVFLEGYRKTFTQFSVFAVYAACSLLGTLNLSMFSVNALAPTGLPTNRTFSSKQIQTNSNPPLLLLEVSLLFLAPVSGILCQGLMVRGKEFSGQICTLPAEQG